MTTPTATLLLGTYCPHCPSILHNLSELVKKGKLSQLNVINIETAPEVARQYGVRSVPWIKIGDYVLTGLQPLEALEQRIEWTKNQNKKLGEYDHLLSHGKAQAVINEIRKNPKNFDIIMKLLSDPGTILSTRIGIGVIMEEFENTDLLRAHINELIQLLDSDDSRLQADAAHYLSFTHDKRAIPALEAHKNTEDTELKELIEDSLGQLQET